jgi:putative flippase GtrA
MEDVGTLGRDNGKNVPSLIAPKLSIIIPTLNERANVEPLVALLAWWLAGVAGAVVGSVWNFAMSSVFTWRRR